MIDSRRLNFDGRHLISPLHQERMRINRRMESQVGRGASPSTGCHSLKESGAARGRGCAKTKTDLAVNQFCKIQTSKSRRFESRLGFLARLAQFAKVPRVFTQPRPLSGSCTGIAAPKETFTVHCRSVLALYDSVLPAATNPHHAVRWVGYIATSPITLREMMEFVVSSPPTYSVGRSPRCRRHRDAVIPASVLIGLVEHCAYCLNAAS